MTKRFIPYWLAMILMVIAVTICKAITWYYPGFPAIGTCAGASFVLGLYTK